MGRAIMMLVMYKGILSRLCVLVRIISMRDVMVRYSSYESFLR